MKRLLAFAFATQQPTPCCTVFLLRNLLLRSHTHGHKAAHPCAPNFMKNLWEIAFRGCFAGCLHAAFLTPSTSDEKGAQGTFSSRQADYDGCQAQSRNMARKDVSHASMPSAATRLTASSRRPATISSSS